MNVADSNRVAGTNVVWLDHPDPVAFSVAGRPGVIAVSRGARDLLRPVALAAALEHEQAHLRGRHHLLLDVVDASAAAVSVVPLFREAPRAMRELVELAADEAAVHRCGSAAVADALRVLSAAPPAAEGIAMANQAVGRRLAHLAAAPAHRGTARRLLVCSAAALGVASLPAMLGLVLWATVACSVG
jgi:beta-lactamase regulating signal transducer with metallopeptidase domain